MRQHALRRPLLRAALTVTIAALSLVPISPALAATGTATITGHLTDAAGHPAAGAFVWAQTNDMSSTGSATTDADGAYSIPNLAAADYRMSFRPAGGGFAQWAHQKTSFGWADPITVGAGATVVVDEQLLPTGFISGDLLNRDGTPATGSVTANSSPENFYIDSHGLQLDGTYRFELPVGAYKLGFRVRDAFTQFNGGALTFEAAAPIQVTAGQTVELHDTVLPTGSIGGRLTNPDGSPAAGASVSVRTPDYSLYSYGTTGADGRYRIDNLLLAHYIVGFAGPNSVTQYAHGTLNPDTAATFAVTDGQVTTVDEAFLPTGKVRIVAHDATSGAPLSGFCAYDFGTSSIGGCTDGTEVVLNDVFVGQYNFEVNIDDRQHFNVRNAAVTVAAGQTTTLDVAMRRGASITARMVKRDGGAATDGCVQVARVGDMFSWSEYGFCSDWQPDPVTGSVVVGPLEPGAYSVIAKPRATDLGMQWLGTGGGTGDRDTAAQFTVAVGDNLQLPKVRFDKAGTIQGKVTDAATGAALPYTCVWVVALSSYFGGSGDCPSSAGADGTYTISGLGPYAWPVEFARGQYQWRWSGNAADRHDAEKVTVKAGKTAKANLKLRDGGGTVTGVVRDASGHQADVLVTAFSTVTGEPVQFIGGRYTPEGQPAGTYTIANIAPQQVKLYWSTDGGRSSGWVGGADFAHAQPVQIRNNKTTTVNITVS
ncbi:carboxypeptidase-like regulatory domain-containing protein [Dactylosporangium sp. CS-047395]|uniref:carboxypeptidase-like regulatory domain-containing protein n=1 Tax=Dactylosporangium sp. CS-047395 TaxID=3239936 RepID=UPI003D94DEA3